MPVNVEFKARHPAPHALRCTLEALGARLHGTDRQIDTYFCVPHGRLKLRQGAIETHLIHYARPDAPGPSRSDVHLYAPAEADDLRQALAAALGVRVVVAKTRQIWYAGSVKIHLDDVDGLGTFVEVEAIDGTGAATPGSEAEAELARRCEAFLRALGVPGHALEARSYSDLLLEAPAAP